MAAVIQSENLKYKHSFARRLAILAPLFFALFGAIAQMYLPAGVRTSWDMLASLIFNWWPLIFIPLGIALLCALSENRELRSGGYRGIRVHNVSPVRLWFGKIVVLAFHTLLSTLALIVVVLFTGSIIASGSIPFLEILKASLLSWLVSLSLIPVQLFVSVWKGMVVSIGLGTFGMVAGVLAAAKSIWYLVPWSWPLRLMCPVVGVHPNGVRLAVGDPLLDPSVVPIGILVSLAFFVVLSVLTALWFSKREVR